MIRFLPMVSLLLLLTATQVSPVQAQSTEDAERPQIEEVMVTATKRETNLQDTAIRVDVFSNDYLKRSNVREFSELTSALPNMIAPDGISGTQNVAIRGVSSPGRGFGVEQPIGVFIDGVFAPPGSLDSYLLDLARIEVIRGPQGAVWGRNTLAGAISYTTARPTEDFSGFVRGQLGNKDLRDLQFALSGSMGNERTLFRLAGAALKQDGFSKRVSGGTYGNKDQVSLRGTLQFLPTDTLDIRLIGDYSNNDFFSAVPEYFSGPFAEISGTDGYTREQDTDFHLPSKTETGGGTLLIDYDFSHLTLSSTTGYRSIKHLQFLDSDGTSMALVSENVDSKTNQFSQELRLSNNADSRARWMVGVYYYHREDDDIGGSNIDGGPFGLPPGTMVQEAIISDQEITSIAAFGTLDFDVTEKLILQAGIRVANEEKKQDSNQSIVAVLPNGAVLPLGPPDAFIADFDDTQVSPMLGLSYQFQQNIFAYASWSRGHKSGGFNSPRVANPVYEPEMADSYEAGIKTSWYDGKLLFNVTGFYIDYTDLQIRGLELTPTGVAQAFYNAGAMSSKGIEVELVAQVTNNWDIFASFGYNDAMFDEFIIPGLGGMDTDLSGNVPPFAPETSFSLRTDYYFSAGDLGEGYLHGEWNYTGSHFLDFNNIPVAGHQDAYSLLNLRLGLIANNGIEVALWGRNLADKDYKVDFIGDLPPVIFQGSQSHLLAPGRTLGIEVAYQF